MHAMALDDAYRVERVLARGSYGVTELVTLDGAGPFVRKKIPLALARRDVWAALGECASPRLPHVEATYELPDLYVVIFDYVPGQTLDKLVGERGRLDPTQAVSIAMQLCQAVSELHRHGIVHRDITPKNVILAADGVHLIDFGIARMRDEEATRDTTALGTWGFASPEQYGFAQTDARSDVYSIGRLLGFMLTGVYPDDAAFERLLADPGLTPPRLREVIERACAFEPSARQSGADRLGLELASWSSGEPLPPDMPVPWSGKGGRSAVSASARKRRRTAIAVISAIVAVALVVAGMFWVVSNLTESGQPSAGGNVPSVQAPSDGTDGDSGDRGTDMPSSPSGSGTDDTVADGNQLVRGILEVTESGWSLDSDGSINYALALHNTSDTMQVEYPTIVVSGRSKNGSIVFSSEETHPTVFPGETVYLTNQMSVSDKPETVEFRVLDPEARRVTTSPGSITFTPSGVTKATDEYSTKFNGEIAANVKGKPNVDDSLGGDIMAVIVFRDANGGIVGGEYTYVSRPQDGEKMPFTLYSSFTGKYKTFDAYAQLT